MIMKKLEIMNEKINSILRKWDQDNIEHFITKARSGELENAEMDAISLRQLLADCFLLKKQLNNN